MILRWPLDNVLLSPPMSPGYTGAYISQVFGAHGQDYSRFNIIGHDGLDIAAPLDTPVYAAHDGFIIQAIGEGAPGTGSGMGIRQYFEENGVGYELTYWHFHKINFPDISYNLNEERYPVKAGDVIGYVDTTGYSTGNHCHFGLRVLNNKVIQNYNNGYHGSIDPLPYLLVANIQYLKKNEQFWQVNEDGTESVVTDEDVLRKLYFGGLTYQTIN